MSREQVLKQLKKRKINKTVYFGQVSLGKFHTIPRNLYSSYVMETC